MSEDERTKDELKEALRERDLPVSGTKAQLQQRLEEAERDDDQGSQEESAAASESDGDAAEADRGGQDASPSAASSGDGERGGRAVAPMRLARLAARQLGQLTSRRVEGVAGLRRTEEGTEVMLEVLEVSRVPNSTDLLGLYAVVVDDAGELVSYERLRRFVRGQASEESP